VIGHLSLALQQMPCGQWPVAVQISVFALAITTAVVATNKVAPKKMIFFMVMIF
jgi:hypothetical protein